MLEQGTLNLEALPQPKEQRKSAGRISIVAAFKNAPNPVTKDWLRQFTIQQRCQLKRMGLKFPSLPRLMKNPKGYHIREWRCSACGKIFKRATHPKSRNKFCSKQCYSSQIGGTKNPKYRGGPVTMNCVICNDLFTQQRNGKELRKTCCQLCLTILRLSKRTISQAQEKVNRAMRKSMLTYLKKGVKAGRKWRDLVGYSPEDLMRHLESLFLPGMNWQNHGNRGWHIDHKRPVCSFRFETTDDPEFKQCWSISNLQPLWWADNIRKGGRLS